MGRIVIKVSDLGKEFVIGAKRQRYATIRESLVEIFRRPFAKPEAAKNRFWALQDISFEVEDGEILGVIGRNGAGKSTLLKILSRISPPTTGAVDLYGRLGALLEVGTGFHPELTGRENVFLNGAILGMSQAEIQTKFDEIVDFAGVEAFIDTALKHYSSGMALRLGFSVAAHLEPEILLIDEVLAVGDAAFQKKCIGKIQDVAGSGRTVLFVSHNMAAVQTICSRAIVIDQGRLTYDGITAEAIKHYQDSFQIPREISHHQKVSFSEVLINQNRLGTVSIGEAFSIEFTMSIQEALGGYTLLCYIEDGNGELVANLDPSPETLNFDGAAGLYRWRLEFPALWLKPSVYNLSFKLLENTLNAGKARYLSENYMLNIIGDVSPQSLMGRLTPALQWHVDKLE